MELSANFKQYVKQPTKEEAMASSSFHDLYEKRVETKTDPQMQNELAPFEHRAFAREFIKDEGIVGAAALAVATPVYTLAKMTGIEAKAKELGIMDYGDKTWAASTNYSGEIKQAYLGIGEGIKELFKEGARDVTGAVNTARKFVGEGLQELFKSKEEAPPKPSKPKGLDIEAIMERLIHTESRGKHTTKGGSLTSSPVGAQGITQLMPKTAKNPGYGIKPVQNDSEEEYIRFGKDYLTKMIDVFGDVEQGVAAYNAGPGKIHNALSKAARTGRDWKEFLPQETKDYVKKVANPVVQTSSGVRG